MATERELIDTAQAAIKAAKQALRELQKVNEAAGRPDVGNAVFLTIAELNVWHGRATERMFQHFPEFAGGVVIQGGGGGR